MPRRPTQTSAATTPTGSASQSAGRSEIRKATKKTPRKKTAKERLHGQLNFIDTHSLLHADGERKVQLYNIKHYGGRHGNTVLGSEINVADDLDGGSSACMVKCLHPQCANSLFYLRLASKEGARTNHISSFADSHFKERHGKKNDSASLVAAKRSFFGRTFVNYTAVLQKRLAQAYANELVAQDSSSDHGDGESQDVTTSTAKSAQATTTAMESAALKILAEKTKALTENGYRVETPHGSGHVRGFPCRIDAGRPVFSAHIQLQGSELMMPLEEEVLQQFASEPAETAEDL